MNNYTNEHTTLCKAREITLVDGNEPNTLLHAIMAKKQDQP